MIPLTVTLEEIKHGPIGAEKLRSIRDKGWPEPAGTKAQVLLDAKSVYESLKATVFKPPSENSLSGHVLWLREMHDKGLVDNLIWTDTRDMYADGLTKGSVPRDLLIEAMSGTIKLRNPIEFFNRRVKRLTYFSGGVIAHWHTCEHCSMQCTKACQFCT